MFFIYLFFCDGILLAGAALPLFNSYKWIQNLPVKVRWRRSVLKVVKKILMDCLEIKVIPILPEESPEQLIKEIGTLIDVNVVMMMLI